MLHAITIFFASVLFTSLFLGCSDEVKESKKREGKHSELNLRIESFAIVLSPLKIADIESLSVASLLYSPLVAVDDNGTVEGRLAKEWKQIDSTTYQFRLHEGLTFTNGKPIKADEVIASLTKAMQPDSPWSWALATIDHEQGENGKAVIPIGLIKEDNYTVTIKLTKPTDWLLSALDSPAGWIFPVTESEKQYGVLPGSGPYKLGEVKADFRIELLARTDDHPLKPQYSRVYFKYIPDEMAAAGQFKRGELDILSLTSPELVKQLVSQEAIPPKLNTDGQLIKSSSQRIQVAIVNTTALMNKGFTDFEVNQFIQQLNHKVDRKRIVSIGGEILSSPLYSVFLPTSSSFRPNKKIFQEWIPMKNFELSVITEGNRYNDQISSILSDTEITGVRFSYKSMEKGVLIQNLVKKEYDIAVILIDANIKSPTFWAAFFTPGNAFTIFGTPIDGLKDVDLFTKEGVLLAGDLISEYGNWVPLTQENRIVATQPGISGLRLTTSGQLRFEKVKKDI